MPGSWLLYYMEWAAVQYLAPCLLEAGRKQEKKFTIPFNNVWKHYLQTLNEFTVGVKGRCLSGLLTVCDTVQPGGHLLERLLFSTRQVVSGEQWHGMFKHVKGSLTLKTNVNRCKYQVNNKTTQAPPGKNNKLKSMEPSRHWISVIWKANSTFQITLTMHLPLT